MTKMQRQDTRFSDGEWKQVQTSFRMICGSLELLQTTPSRQEAERQLDFIDVEFGWLKKVISSLREKRSHD